MTATTSFADPLVRLRVAEFKDWVWENDVLPSERIVGAGCHYFRSTEELAGNHRFIPTDEQSGEGLVRFLWVAIDTGEVVIDLTLPAAINTEDYAAFRQQLRAALDSADSKSALRDFGEDSCRFCPEYTYEEPERDSWSDGQGGADDE